MIDVVCMAGFNTFFNTINLLDYRSVLRYSSKYEIQDVQKKADDLAKSMGISQPVEVVSYSTQWDAWGMDGGPLRNVIVIPSYWDYKTSWGRNTNCIEKEAIPFLLAKHMVSIKNGDTFWRAVIPAISSIMMSLFIGLFAPAGAGYALGMLTLGISRLVVNRQQERRAEIDACEHTTDREKLAYVYHLRKAVDTSLLQSSSHPYRIEKILATMEIRPEVLDDEVFKKGLEKEEKKASNLKERASNKGYSFEQWERRYVIDEQGNFLQKKYHALQTGYGLATIAGLIGTVAGAGLATGFKNSLISVPGAIIGLTSLSIASFSLVRFTDSCASYGNMGSLASKAGVI